MQTLLIRSLPDIAQDGDAGSPAARVHHAHSMPPHTVRLPPLVSGAAFLRYWPVREEPSGASWLADSYICMAPATFVLRDAMVHASAGIIAIGEDVLLESLVHTDPVAHGYTPGAGTIAVDWHHASRLAGTHVTVLAGGKRNYFHSIVESAARVCMTPAHLLHTAATLMFPDGAVHQPDMLRLLPLPPSLQMVAMADTDTVLVERLVFPWSVHGQSSYHPVLRTFFADISANIADGTTHLPRRIYIDRRGVQQRVLENEDDVVAGLLPFGIVPVQPDKMAFADQVRLFRGAELIVAPHGAGLTNIGFARPGCRVLELHMDAYVHWCFRHLAALCEVGYDCVVGKAAGPWLDVASGAVHAMRWRISADHVRAAVDLIERV